MKVCFVHVRVSIAAGHVIPDLNFQAHVTSQEIATSITSKVEKKSEERSRVSQILKPRERKSEELPPIRLANLDENDLRETLLKLKGLRYDRELIVETYSNLNYTSDSLDGGSHNMTSTNSDTVHSMKKEMIEIKDKRSNKRETSKMESEASGTKKGHVVDSGFNTDDKVAKVRTYAAALTENTDNTFTQSPSNLFSNKKLLETEDHVKNVQQDLNSSEKLEHEASSKAQRKSCSRSNSRSGRYTPSLGDSPKTTSVPFFSGNPAVDITNGIVHLYKTNFRVPISEDLPPPKTKMLCMLSVPASIDAHSIMKFTAPYMDVIHWMRIIRDRTPNEYMVLITFITEQDACDFFLNLNNQFFSSLIPEEICHLAFVASVEALAPYDKDSDRGGAYLPLPNSTELPDCMVCLERMDESVQGLLTILCNHSFHAACLKQWEDLCCPVCRYVQTPEPQSDNKCMVCGGSEELWICLVCGNVGCGRYTSEHAQRHYLETHHNYAMSLSDNRVWDYAGDYFVHRLFQNKEDGKLVEKQGLGSEEGVDTKLEGIQLECMHLLTSQLESQRKYWEDQVATVEKKASGDQKQLADQLQTAMEKYEETRSRITAFEKEKQSLSHRNEHLAAKMRDTLKDLANERELNKSLNQNQDVWKTKVDSLEERCRRQDEEISELKEQLRDIMFYIEASQKIKTEDPAVRDEIRDGQLLVGPSGSSGESGTSRNRGKGRRPR